MKKNLFEIFNDGAAPSHEMITDAMVMSADAGLDKARIAALTTEKLGLNKKTGATWYKKCYKQIAAIAACIAIVCATAFVVMLGGESGVYPPDVPEEDIVRPPVRESENQIFSSFLSIPIEEYAEVVDAIVRLKIGNWIGESYYHDNTYYFAEVVDVYKGNVPESIILSQVGTSQATHQGFPLFTYGEELILFIGKYDTERNTEDGLVLNVDISEFDVDNIYGIYGRHLNTWNVASLDSGNAYVVPMIAATVTDNDLLSSTKGLTNYGSALPNGITSEAIKAAQILISIDPYDNPGEEPEYVLELEKFVEYLKEVSK